MDVRYTLDNVLVCINRWSSDTLRTLGIITENATMELTYDEFKGLKYYDRYPAITFDELIQHLSRYSGEKFHVIIDVGHPGSDDRSILYQEIDKTIKKYDTGKIKFLLKVETDADIRRIKELKLKYEMIFFLPYSGSNISPAQKDAFYLCKRHGIRLISMDEKTYTEPVKKALNKYDMKAVLMTVDKVGSIIRYVTDDRIRYIGSARYDPDYMNALTR